MAPITRLETWRKRVYIAVISFSFLQLGEFGLQLEETEAGIGIAYTLLVILPPNVLVLGYPGLTSRRGSQEAGIGKCSCLLHSRWTKIPADFLQFRQTVDLALGVELGIIHFYLHGSVQEEGIMQSVQCFKNNILFCKIAFCSGNHRLYQMGCNAGEKVEACSAGRGRSSH